MVVVFHYLNFDIHLFSLKQIHKINLYFLEFVLLNFNCLTYSALSMWVILLVPTSFLGRGPKLGAKYCQVLYCQNCNQCLKCHKSLNDNDKYQDNDSNKDNDKENPRDL